MANAIHQTLIAVPMLRATAVPVLRARAPALAPHLPAPGQAIVPVGPLFEPVLCVTLTHGIQVLPAQPRTTAPTTSPARVASAPDHSTTAAVAGPTLLDQGA